MCRTCGCDDASARLTDLTTGRIEPVQGRQALPDLDDAHGQHHHAHDHGGHGKRDGHTIALQEAVLAKNDRLAAENRRWLQARRVLALNLLSSPGSGKTTLLERTIRDLSHERPIQVIEGDQETTNDAERIRRTGCRVVQINTGAGCHLDSAMVGHALRHLAPVADSVLMIENVGNLVCPALFDLGETAKVIIFSVVEGEDKPLKYPHMFRAAQVMLLNKIDLLPHLNFDVERCVQHARTINPEMAVLRVSALSGEGMEAWYDWLRTRPTA